MVLFKKLQGLKGRKYVNPAAAAKLLVLVFFIGTAAFLPIDHNMAMPTLAAPLYYDKGSTASNSIPFGVALQTSYGNKSIYDTHGNVVASVSQFDVLWTLLVQKFHGWAGGASSIAVIAVGIALFALCRRYIKWRITTVYLVTVALFALALNFVYGGDPVLRIAFHLFAGSSIFLAFFMATDPATTPLTYAGQAVFGVGLGLITVLIQVYMNFLGGSILALVLMNLTSPYLDRLGKMKPITERKEPKLPKAKQFKAVKVTDCIRCGACMRSCCLHLSPILVKQAFDKQDFETCKKLQANLCEGCGHCSFVCPARIDLKGTMLRTKGALRTMQ
jgi:Na+-translocating ferredoxin:NAD+ oxidoreductase RnfD subunit